MDVTPLVDKHLKIIQGYSDASFSISGEVYETPVLVWPDCVKPWDVTDFETLKAEDLAPVQNTGVEVLLLGTGATGRFVKPEILNPLKQSGVNVEVMSTAAACRTYNVLISEGRRVMAALLLV